MRLPMLALAAAVLASNANGDRNDYDILIFAQSWPVTTCIEWKERRDSNACNLPSGDWTIHGIWPSKLGQRGPNDCDKSIKFDSSKIQDIKPQLEDQWTDVHKNSRRYGFWQHEYEKHGSCATDLPELDTQQEYFRQGIEWNRKYDIRRMLDDEGVTPGGDYTWLEVYLAVKKGLGGRKPAVQCEHDKERGVKTLSQVYICFDKSLRIIDCTGVSGGLNIGCPRKAKFRYPAPSRVGVSDNNSNSRQPLGSDKEYDLFIFAQTWPITNCIEWKERSEKNTCNLPAKIWTVHGLWPTKYGEIGPGFCDPKDKFDPTDLKPILHDLEDHWTNVHKNSAEFGFWEHEWTKHGTCAKDNPQLNSEYKYFHMGIELNEKYRLSEYLSAARITPGGTYTYEEIFDAVKRRIGGRNPAVQCEWDRDAERHVLAQIDICLDKGLDVVDCDRIHGGLNHGCPTRGQKVFYPDLRTVAGAGKLWIVFTVVVVVALLSTISYVGYKKWWAYRLSNGYQSI